MTSTIVPNFDHYYPVAPQQEDSCSSLYTLQWRRGQLLVKPLSKFPQPYLPALDNQQLLVECLKHSSVNLVSIDAKLGETVLHFWAEACEQAHKPLFIRTPSTSKLWRRASQGAIWLQLIDRVIAGVLLLLLSPTMPVLMMLMQVYSPSLLFTREWRVGEKGKLFRAIKFSTTNQQKSTPLGRWLHKSGLEHLPQLWNVLRGEMSLIGTRFWTWEDAMTLTVITTWEIETESQRLHLDSQTL